MIKELHDSSSVYADDEYSITTGIHYSITLFVVSNTSCILVHCRFVSARCISPAEGIPRIQPCIDEYIGKWEVSYICTYCTYFPSAHFFDVLRISRIARHTVNIHVIRCYHRVSVHGICTDVICPYIPKLGYQVNRFPLNITVSFSQHIYST